MTSIDPAGTNALTAPGDWLQGALLGMIATAVAIIAVASIGIMMLTGRIDFRRAAQAIFGCFIIFGASTIASGILRAVEGDVPGANAAPVVPPAPPALPQPQAAGPPSAAPFDPYAGAGLPRR